MDPSVYIEGYVRDVIGRLPRRQRADVGFELRSLLREELAGRADDAGRPADEAMVMELLAAFGRPQDVADRYRPAGFTVIRPADAPRFAWVALGGVALQWAITLPAVYLDPTANGWAAGSSDWLTLLGRWWLSWGLGSFWWPGFLISVTLIAAMIGHRRNTAPGADGDAGTDSRTDSGTDSGSGTRAIPRSTLDRDRINRPGLALALAFWMLGASVLIALPWLPVLAPGLPQPVLDAFVFDPEFLRWRAPWVLVIWAASFAVGFAVLIAGRYNRATRLISLVIDVALLALLLWCLVAGPVFAAPTTDGVVRLCLVGIMAITVVDIVVTLRRGVLPLRAPAARA